jgi:hypothetical protein
MRTDFLFSLGAIAALAFAGVAGLQELTRSFVVNLKDPHPVEGAVEVVEPIPHTTLQSISEVIVSPAPRSEPSLWTEAGVLETDGFTTAVVSFHGQFRGSPSAPGAFGAVLVPEEENVLRAFAEGEAHLVLEAVADPVPNGRLYFSASRGGLAIAFPRYRVFLYNTTDRSASVNVFAYLTH